MASKLIQRTNAMLDELRGLGGSDITYIFSPFFKPVEVPLHTIFGAVINFPSQNVFSQDKVRGFKAVVNKYSDILTGYVRIGDVVHYPDEAHEYKTLPASQGRELMKALASRAVKITKFDLSMLKPEWLGDEIDDQDYELKEAEDFEHVADDIPGAINMAMNALEQQFGDYNFNELQTQEMAEMLADAGAPYVVELTPSRDGIQIVGQNNIGVMLYNDNGELWWEF